MHESCWGTKWSDRLCFRGLSVEAVRGNRWKVWAGGALAALLTVMGWDAVRAETPEGVAPEVWAKIARYAFEAD